MLKQYFRKEQVRQRIAVNLLSSEIEELIVHLDKRGHPPSTIQLYVQVVEHFGRWLGQRRIRNRLVNREAICLFIENHLPRCKCPTPAPRYVHTTRAALMHLLSVAGKKSIGEVPGSRQNAAEKLVLKYISHLETNCGLASATCYYRARYAQEFLDAQFPDGNLHLSRLKPKDVEQFICDYAVRRKRSSTQVVASSIRSLLRYLSMRGLSGQNLVGAVPHIPQWRLSDIPRTMTPEQCRCFLNSFDRSIATGRRDYAMALCMLDLGLRVSEVVQIDLEDIDWRGSVMEVHCDKQRKSRLLPLPKRVAQSIASYIKSGRPTSSCRRVFLRHRVPIGTAVGRELVRGVIRRAYKRSGFDPSWTGTHILRHTAATIMHQQGATLKEVADVLGHSSIETSAIYAKVNLPMLKSVALPWLEVQS